MGCARSYNSRSTRIFVECRCDLILGNEAIVIVVVYALWFGLWTNEGRTCGLLNGSGNCVG